MTATPATAVGLADLATNVLAVVVVALLLVTAAAPPESAAPAIDPAAVVLRRPLGPDAMVAHLAALRPAAGAAVVEVGADRLTVRRGGVRTAIAPGDGAGLRAALAGSPPPVRLDVFSNRTYAAAVAALGGAGLAFTELSVPAALRAPDGEHWSSAFEDLAAGADSPAAFRAGLADLLAGSTIPVADPGGRPSGGGGAVARALAWLDGLAAAVALVTVAVVLVVIEIRFIRAGR